MIWDYQDIISIGMDEAAQLVNDLQTCILHIDPIQLGIILDGYAKYFKNLSGKAFDVAYKKIVEEE